MDHDATNFSICSHLFHHRFEAYFQQAKHRARRLVRGFFICGSFLKKFVPCGRVVGFYLQPCWVCSCREKERVR